MTAAPKSACKFPLVLVLGLSLTLLATAAEPFRMVGVARIDVTPADPIRLTGYGGRTTNSIGVEQRLWAKAFALGGDTAGPAILMTLDNCGIADSTYRELVTRLARAGVKQDHLALACSHTHSGPCTTHWAPNIFSRDIPPEQQATIDRYTRDLIDKLEQVALAALKDRRPGRISWSQGNVGFARNRRVVVGNTTQFGENAAAPVDHALPVLRVEDSDGKLRALVANYACHCTTLGGEFNKLCGDWAGYAQQYLERDHPGAIAMITIGCGADANPFPRGGADGGLALCRTHGEEIAAEVNRLLAQNFTPLTARLTTRLKEIELPFGTQFTRDQWEERAKKSGIVGYHARKNLARLDRGEKLPTQLYYPVGTWNFGDELALVFLPGEVVVDYALRLKKDFDPARLWVTAYANYVPCYIPSRRILAEGGYEAEDSLWYYDRPTRISTNAEDLIIRTVHELMPEPFLFDRKKAEFPDAKSPQQALATFRTKADFAVELVASEPLIESPVAIDWGADGRLWVCEMFDYPAGVNGQWKPGGRIKVLRDTDGDGRYDQATLFLDGLAFPTGVTPWRNGALICAAPDILYAEDTDGDGHADVVRTNFTGFATHNFQARVNGFIWGLDGWLHGSSGLFGGKVKSLATGKEVDLSGRDFRIKPDMGEIEPVSGISQMGRVRDDFENWFGNDNSTLLWHYPLPDHYVRRNPHVTYPDPRCNVAQATRRPRSPGNSARKGTDAGDTPPLPYDPNQLYPISRTLERFNDPQAANRTTSACGPEIYRDDLLGTNYYGNAFICEPVHNLVTRLVLEPAGVSFAGHRADDEQRSEFLASTDNWFRPVQVRCGPDGALWIVDMYRFVIEHPRWIPTNRLAQLDVRAGADLGRIYRVYPRGTKLRPIRDLNKLNDLQLAEALNTPNGQARDAAHRELLQRQTGVSSTQTAGNARDRDQIPALLRRLGTSSSNPAIRAQALSIAASWPSLPTDTVQRAFADADNRVRRELLRLIEKLPETPSLRSALTAGVRSLVDDSDPAIRFQLALTLGESNDQRADEHLAKLARADDRWIRAAVLSSALPFVPGILKAARDWPASVPGRSEFIAQLCSLAVVSGENENIQRALEVVAPAQASDTTSYEALAALLGALDRQSIALDTVLATSTYGPRTLAALAGAHTHATNTSDDESLREQSIRLLARQASDRAGDVSELCRLLLPPASQRLQYAALDRLRSQRDPDIARQLLARWTDYSPALRPRVIGLLLAREDWTRALLAALKEGAVAPAEMSPADQQRLLKHSSDAVRELSSSLFRGVSTRTEVLAKYENASSLEGTPDHGAAIFDRNCAQCHAYRGHGHAVGPNLAEFTGKSAQDFLVAILDPSSAINPNFLAYNIDTKDGRSLTGIVKGETASSLSLIQWGGVEENILRSDIAEIRASEVSLMPEGLEQAMTPQDIADLVAWLKNSAPAPFGGANPAQIARARAEFLNRGVNGLAEVMTCADRLLYPSWLGRLPMPYCRQTEGQNRLVWQTAPVAPSATKTTTQRFRLPAAMGFMSQPPGGFSLKLSGVPVLDFDVTLSDQTWQSPAGKVRMNYTVMECNAEDSNGVLEIDVDLSLLQPGRPAEFEVAGAPVNSQRWFGVYLVPQ